MIDGMWVVWVRTGDCISSPLTDAEAMLEIA
jgi:hypothetical protein